MGATLIAEQIRNIGRSKKIEEVFSKIVSLEKLYREYDDTCKKGELYRETEKSRHAQNCPRRHCPKAEDSHRQH
eukprot:5343746-Karenia_brevis.AAC.1